MLGDLGVVGTILAPEPRGARAHQHDIARRQAHALPGERVLQILGRDPGVAGQGFHLLEAGDIDEHTPRDDRRDGRRVALARTPVAAPIRLLEAVVPVVVRGRP